MEDIKETKEPEENEEEEVNQTESEPQEENKTPFISVKFNKETRDLTEEETRNLAQKGLKYEQIENEYTRFKTIAKEKGLSVEEYLNGIENETANARKALLLEQTGGNEELTDYILSLESKRSPKIREFEELKEMFPEIKEIGELPEEVIESSNLNGKNLLDSYLRYLLKEKKIKDKEKREIKAANKIGIGSLKAGKSADGSALDREFINALWSKR